MANQEYTKGILKKAAGIVLSVVVVLFFIYFADSFSAAEPLPENLVDGYKETIEESKEVTDISNSAAERIKKVSDLESEGKIDDALNLIGEVRVDNDGAKDKASALLDQLEKLTELVLNMDEHRQKKELAEAINTEFVMVTEFVNYTLNMDQFLESLSVAIASDKEEDRARVENSLRLLNEKRETINDLGEKFLAKASQLGIFD